MTHHWKEILKRQKDKIHENSGLHLLIDVSSQSLDASHATSCVRLSARRLRRACDALNMFHDKTALELKQSTTLAMLYEGKF